MFHFQDFAPCLRLIAAAHPVRRIIGRRALRTLCEGGSIEATAREVYKQLQKSKT